MRNADREKKISNMKIRAQYQNQINEYAQKQEEKLAFLRGEKEKLK